MDNKNLIVVERGNAYTVLHNEKNTLTPWIVAWHFDPDSFTWDHGHYDRKEWAIVNAFSEAYHFNGHDSDNAKEVARKKAVEIGALDVFNNFYRERA